jgi:hypothetical protein
MSRLLLRFASHVNERIDKVVDRFMPFSFTPHPDERVEKVIDMFVFFRHAAC